jgi:SRSO17 transposase
MQSRRNVATIARLANVSEQNMQHFMSASPWSGRAMIADVQAAVAQRGDLAGGVLIVDECGEDKQGQHSAGVKRQYNGRHRRVENCQVGVYLSYGQGSIWSWIDGELYLPPLWFTPAYEQHRLKADIPPRRCFQTKIELGWHMIQRAQAAGVPFVAVAFDCVYGEDSKLGDRCREHNIEYYADIRSSTQVYLQPPEVVRPPNQQGKLPAQHRILSPWSVTVKEIAEDPSLLWQSVELRPDERGWLTADFATCAVWMVREDGRVVADTLLVRRDPHGHLTYSLTNAAPDTPLLTLAQRKSQRYFIERTNQDAKSELGWDEFQAIKYTAWEHHLAFTILASWFIAETRLDWELEHPRDLTLLDDYQTDSLPALSVANVRELLRAAMPLPQLSSQQAARLVAQHLDNRTRSRRSRLKRRYKPLM